jgi:hypothetical protein
MACMLACLQLQHEQRSWDRQVTEVGRISCCEVQSSRYFCMAKASTSEPPKNQSLLTPSTKRYRWRSPFWGELGGVAASPIRIPRSCPSRLKGPGGPAAVACQAPPPLYSPTLPRSSTLSSSTYFPIRPGPALYTTRMSILCRAYEFEFERKAVLVSHRTSPLEFENQPLLRNPVDFLASKAKRAQQCRQAVPFLSPHSWLPCSGNPKAYPWKFMHPSSWLCTPAEKPLAWSFFIRSERSTKRVLVGPLRFAGVILH